MTRLHFDMTEDQRCLLDTCLMVAIERFQENAKTPLETMGFTTQLADQFQQQAKDATELRGRLEDAAYITIGSAVVSA